MSFYWWAMTIHINEPFADSARFGYVESLQSTPPTWHAVKTCLFSVDNSLSIQRAR